MKSEREEMVIDQLLYLSYVQQRKDWLVINEQDTNLIEQLDLFYPEWREYEKILTKEKEIHHESVRHP